MVEYTTTEIAELSLEGAYKAFLLELHSEDKEEQEQLQELYKKARFGIHIRFDINEYFAKVVYLDEDQGEFAHKVRPRRIDATDMYTELEEREKIIKKTLLESAKEQPFFKGIKV